MVACSRVACSRVAYNFATVWQPDQRRRTLHQCFQVRAQKGFGEEGGKSRRHIDNANLRLLRDRMEVIRIKESLERSFSLGHDNDEHAGWNGGYAPAIINHYKHKKKVKQSHIFEFLVIVCGTFGMTILSCTLCLCLASIFVHLNH